MQVVRGCFVMDYIIYSNTDLYPTLALSLCSFWLQSIYLYMYVFFFHSENGSIFVELNL